MSRSPGAATAELLAAIGAVDRNVLPRLARLAASRPRSYHGAAWARWQTLCDEAEEATRAALDKAGAGILIDYRGATISLAGITSTSTMGLTGAVRNWRKAAEKRLGGPR